MFKYLEHGEYITDSDPQPPPPPVPRSQTELRTGALLRNYIAEPWQPNTQSWLETTRQRNPHFLFATLEDYKYIQCGIKKKGIKTYYDNMLKEGNTTLCLKSFKNGDGVQKLMASIPYDHGVRKWERHTLIDKIWNDHHQHPIKYWSRHII